MDAGALARVLTHIEANLDGDLSLGALGGAAGCSAPYFARRFAAVVGETPKQYTQRLRLERAALRLVLTADSVLRVGLDCGFAGQEVFGRAFRRRFGVSPQVFRDRGRLPRGGVVEAAQRVEGAAEVSLSSTVVRTLQPMWLACLRHTGPYEEVPIGSWDLLMEWARRQRIPGPQVLMGIAHDAPGITDTAKLRFDAAVRVPGEFRSRGRVASRRFEGGVFAMTTSAGPLAALPRAYREVMGRLRADAAVECVGVPCVEFYRVNRVVTDVAIVSTEIAIPFRRREGV